MLERAAVSFGKITCKLHYLDFRSYKTILFQLFSCLQKFISCSGSVEECASLASSLVSLESWLWTLTADCLKILCESSAPTEYFNVCNSTTKLLSNLYEDDYLIALLYIARCSDEQFSANHLVQLTNQIESNLNRWSPLNNSGGDSQSPDLADSIKRALK